MFGHLVLLLASLASIVAGKDAEAKFEVESIYNRLGNLSPYHKAPVPSGVQQDLPADCTVDQVMLLGRHGSRYPLASELVYITNLTAKLASGAEYIQKQKLPENLKFLKKGYTTTLGHDDLTAPGRRQLFDHGVEQVFRLKYQHLEATSVLAGGQDRVIESAQWFSQGYFGRVWPNISASVFSVIPEDSVTISWITPMNTCPKWEYDYGGDLVNIWDAVYLPPITKRLNKALPGLNLTDDDTHGGLYACAYDHANAGVSPWCDVFTDFEIAGFEYELDLLMDGAFGYNLPTPMGPTLGSLYVSKLIDRFSNSTGNASALYLEFGHDTTIDLTLTALGLAKDTLALPSKGPIPTNRKFRTSNQVPFAAQMIWEKFTCSSSFKDTQIRLVLNDAPFPLTTCAESRQDKQYGSCSFANFVSSNNFSSSIAWGDAAWNATCGIADF